MKSFFKTTLAGLIGSFIAILLVILIGFIVIAGIVSSGDETVELKEKTILHLELKTPLADRSGTVPDLQSLKFNKKLGIRQITNLLEDAAQDEKIEGIFIEPSVFVGGLATTEELRNALLEFKESGKFIIAHADLYTHKSYYLASVADKVYLNPAGMVQFTGLSAQIMFFKSMLDKVGIDPVIIRYGKFKSAVEPFMQNSMSEANREQTTKYISTFWNTMVEGISNQRQISVEDLNKYADSLYISSAQNALDYGLVDALLYKDQVEDELRKLTETELEKDLEYVALNKYAKAGNKFKITEKFSDNKIAVIYAEGGINTGKSDAETIGSESLAEEIRKVRKDSTIKAIVLRVNSPGGSALASEVIWRETILAQQEKPFIVSMGDVAASGGYYIACAADTIVAQPTTITGSIGVFGLLFNAEELMNTIGISMETVNTNKFADIGNPARKMTEFEKDNIQKGVNDIYSVFINHVADGRNMTADEIDAIGQGRVWSGTDALEIGLVDVLGGLGTAIQIAKEKAQLEEYRIISYPEKDKFQKMFEELTAEVKIESMKEHTGFLFSYIQRLKKLEDMEGTQARLPFYIDIE
jgi:protease IV